MDEARMPMYLLMMRNRIFNGSEYLCLHGQYFFFSLYVVKPYYSQNHNKDSLYQFAKINHSGWGRNFLIIVYYHPKGKPTWGGRS